MLNTKKTYLLINMESQPQDRALRVARYNIHYSNRPVVVVQMYLSIEGKWLYISECDTQRMIKMHYDPQKDEDVLNFYKATH